LYSDHRFVKFTNEMIFGTRPGTAAGDQTTGVSEDEGQTLLAMVNNLANARQTL
jgi:hypothetical protein